MTHELPIGRRAVIRSALLGSSAALLLFGTEGRAYAGSRSATSVPAPGGAVLTLPAPTGRHPVGRRSVHLVDGSRPDPWEPGIPERELMLTVFYPARDTGAGAPAPQLPPLAARVFAEIAPLTPLRLPRTGVDWGATLSHSFPDAPVLPGRRPLLVHSPGGGDPRGLGTSLAEELASHGAVVVSVDHPGDAVAVEFPGSTPYRDGPVRTTVLRGDPRDQPPVARALIDARVADLHFVLDRLRHAPDALLPCGLAGVVDPRRVGVYGHSAGGSAVTEVLHGDRAIRAGINLEGHLDHPPLAPGDPAEPFPVVTEGLDRPLLLLGTDGFARREELDRSWSALVSRSGRWVRRGRLADADHWVLTDCAAMVPQLEAAGLMSAAERNRLIGTVSPTVSVPGVRGTVRRFFARHLAMR
ncbi:alpha/beta hydrolase [Streptomyces sp. NPDC000594]|uniref:alpha/beta hydrolase n=1 Tax=Streptomyces sp. NPDC000594 TaxID=3154261 RepID=UPI003316BB83